MRRVLPELRDCGQPLSILIASRGNCTAYMQSRYILHQFKLVVTQLPDAYSALNVQHNNFRVVCVRIRDDLFQNIVSKSNK